MVETPKGVVKKDVYSSSAKYSEKVEVETTNKSNSTNEDQFKLTLDDTVRYISGL